MTNVLLVARPTVAAWSEASAEVGDTSLLDWVNQVLKEVAEPKREKV